jgi:hypothetical protein
MHKTWKKLFKKILNFFFSFMRTCVRVPAGGAHMPAGGLLLNTSSLSKGSLVLQYVGVAEPSWPSAKYRFTIKRLCTVPHFQSIYERIQTENMVLSEGDKAIIEACVRGKRWGAKRTVKKVGVFLYGQKIGQEGKGQCVNCGTSAGDASTIE